MTQNPTPANGTWTVRGCARDEFHEVVRVVGQALLISDDLDTIMERMRPLYDAEGYDRVLVAVDGEPGGEGIVGSTNHFPFTMALPGGAREVAGVTGVGVWPTHRRRGVLSALMRRQLADVHASGSRYAALWATEGSIYGRFGYGPAAAEWETAIRREYAVLRPDVPRDAALRVRLAAPSAVRGDLERVHRQVAAVQVGQFQRAAQWWDKVLSDRPDARGGKSLLAAAVVTGPEGPLGYALYRTRNKWDDDGPRGEVVVQEIAATAPAAWTALYEHLFHRDLTSRIDLGFLAEDNPLRHLVADRNRIVSTVTNSLWVRLVDVPGALSERSYAAPVEAVVEVADRYAPWNAGRWRLLADRDGARVERADDAPDVSLDVSHLGAAYLGQTSLSGFLGAGLLTEHTSGAVAALDAALHRADAPFCGLVF